MDCTKTDCVNIMEQHATLDATILGKMAGLTLAQKQKLSTKMDEWISKL